MRVALSIPVEFDGATFEFLMPDDVTARLVPAMANLFDLSDEMLTTCRQALDQAAQQEGGEELVGAATRIAATVFDRLAADVRDVLVPDHDPVKHMAFGMALSQPETLALLNEAFDKGVIAWTGMEFADGSPMACSEKNKAYIGNADPLAKTAAVLLYLAQQRDLAQKKGAPT